MKIYPEGAELFHMGRRTDGRTDGQIDRETDMTKLLAAFRNSADTPKKGKMSYVTHFSAI
jgi:hypothetical protein